MSKVADAFMTWQETVATPAQLKLPEEEQMKLFANPSKLKWFLGAVHVGNKQRASLVIAKSRAHAVRLLAEKDIFVGSNHIKVYWYVNEPRNTEYMSSDAKEGVYLAKDMSYPHIYKKI